MIAFHVRATVLDLITSKTVARQVTRFELEIAPHSCVLQKLEK